jgi:dTMP kinase
MKRLKRGKLIVIDGLDGAGKATQAELLLSRLRRAGYKTGLLDFPQYGETFFGDMVGLYLNGAYGQATTVNPYLASLLYAFDRWQAKPKIERWLREGRIIVANRYTTSSAIHQTAKMSNRVARISFLRWLNELEHAVLGVPKPDLVLFLNVPGSIGRKLVKKKGLRGYVGTGQDQHERSRKHQADAEANAKELARKLKWTVVPCVTKGAIDDRSVIAERVWKIVDNHIH